ncbi:unnamed protein product [Amoebophrya sp. A120]|nr:unnamed protein product [Amoebophrya sp. A120]|eukprot:GSA120T00007802001.1
MSEDGYVSCNDRNSSRSSGCKNETTTPSTNSDDGHLFECSPCEPDPNASNSSTDEEGEQLQQGGPAPVVSDIFVNAKRYEKFLDKLPKPECFGTVLLADHVQTREEKQQYADDFTARYKKASEEEARIVDHKNVKPQSKIYQRDELELRRVQLAPQVACKVLDIGGNQVGNVVHLPCYDIYHDRYSAHYAGLKLELIKAVADSRCVAVSGTFAQVLEQQLALSGTPPPTAAGSGDNKNYVFTSEMGSASAGGATSSSSSSTINSSTPTTSSRVFAWEPNASVPYEYARYPTIVFQNSHNIYHCPDDTKKSKWAAGDATAGKGTTEVNPRPPTTSNYSKRLENSCLKFAFSFCPDKGHLVHWGWIEYNTLQKTGLKAKEESKNTAMFLGHENPQKQEAQFGVFQGEVQLANIALPEEEQQLQDQQRLEPRQHRQSRGRGHRDDYAVLAGGGEAGGRRYHELLETMLGPPPPDSDSDDSDYSWSSSQEFDDDPIRRRSTAPASASMSPALINRSKTRIRSQGVESATFLKTTPDNNADDKPDGYQKNYTNAEPCRNHLYYQVNMIHNYYKKNEQNRPQHRFEYRGNYPYNRYDNRDRPVPPAPREQTKAENAVLPGCQFLFKTEEERDLFVKDAKTMQKILCDMCTTGKFKRVVLEVMGNSDGFREKEQFTAVYENKLMQVIHAHYAERAHNQYNRQTDHTNWKKIAEEFVLVLDDAGGWGMEILDGKTRGEAPNHPVKAMDCGLVMEQVFKSRMHLDESEGGSFSDPVTFRLIGKIEERDKEREAAQGAAQQAKNK